MKEFDIKSDFNEYTYEDEYILSIIERNDGNKTYNSINLNSEELLNLYDEVRHAIDTTI